MQQVGGAAGSGGAGLAATLRAAGGATDTSLAVARVRQDGFALEHADERMRRSFVVVMAAVQQNGLALRFAHPALQADEDIVMAAVQQNGLALEYAGDALKSDRDVVLSAVHRRPAHRTGTLPWRRCARASACSPACRCRLAVGTVTSY